MSICKFKKIADNYKKILQRERRSGLILKFSFFEGKRTVLGFYTQFSHLTAVFLHRMGIKWTFIPVWGRAPNMPWRGQIDSSALCGDCEGCDSCEDCEARTAHRPYGAAPECNAFPSREKHCTKSALKGARQSEIGTEGSPLRIPPSCPIVTFCGTQ